MSYYYLATPYSKYEAGLEGAFHLAARNTALLIRAGVPTFSPIAHTHPVAVHGNIDPYDYDVWIPADKPMMDAACGLIVLMAAGWDQSKGVAIEIEEFKKAGKPVVYMMPGVVPETLLQRAA
jgi:hypothetical protein